MPIHFWATVLLTRKTPAFKGYRPNLRFDIPGLDRIQYGLVELYDTDGPVIPGEETLVYFTMYGHPDFVAPAKELASGTRFMILEGGTDVGSGIVEEVVERSLDE